MSEPRRSTRTRIRDDAASEPPKETPTKTTTAPKSSLKRKRPSVVAKDLTPATPLSETPQHAPKHVLPIKVVDGQPLPTLRGPQQLDLASNEYQDIQSSGVLNTSLQRSRAVWTSGSNFRLFHALFIPPKKVADRSEEDKQNIQRQKEIVRNFPQVGGSVEALLVIEPHTFPIRLYGPREMARPAPKKAPTYGQWPNHNQFSPYQQHNNVQAMPYAKPSAPQQRPAHSKPVPPKPQAPAPQANTAPPRANTAPAPDPVIHMLAQRAGTDPELKAVMKIVAAGQATKEQLEFFQSHISELTSILQKQKEAAIRALPPPPRPPPPPPPPAVAPVPPRPIVQPVQQSPNVSKPFSPAPSAPFHPHVAPATPNHPPRPTTYSPAYGQPHYAPSYGPASQPHKPTYRPLVFDFSEGNGDKFYFPSYSFMEWLPNGQGVKFSFLITKMKPKPKVATTETTPAAPVPAPIPAPMPAPMSAPMSAPIPAPMPAPMPMATLQPSVSANTESNTPTLPPSQNPAAVTTPYVPPPRIEDFDEKNDIKDIELYQPVTILILTNSLDILQSLPRAVRPQDIVEKYMNEVFDTCKRAEETYLAFRLPKATDVESDERRIRESADATPTVSTPVADVVMGGVGSLEKKRAGRPRKSLV
ncbi:hypothetical protein K504DRAFT_455396 [Pleomassaria siparia CBS 279.74]|uniref:SWR1-complex protein 3 domain-containing protein n=1 Tax=Pleomassaria siparia CBS 279.74 TaxID=1314801 RepID=A0A6G1KB96_9PLEO|nr:hypothetical protein K504DRAFT_455396 [Pleomassaria siparia CBS 279.74]